MVTIIMHDDDDDYYDDDYTMFIVFVYGCCWFGEYSIEMMNFYFVDRRHIIINRIHNINFVKYNFFLSKHDEYRE